MRRIQRAQLIFLCGLTLVTSSLSAVQTFTVRGKVLWPEEDTSAARIKLILSSHGLIHSYGWPQPDGKFVLHNVPAGSHMLDIAAIGVIYPQLRLDVSAKGGGRVLATFADNDLQRLPEPLLIRPVARAEYFEKRTPFNVVNFLKSPYGLMLIFGAAAVFVLPQLKVDPEEYRELMQQASPAAAPAASGGSTRALPAGGERQARRR